MLHLPPKPGRQRRVVFGHNAAGASRWPRRTRGSIHPHPGENAALQEAKRHISKSLMNHRTLFSFIWSVADLPRGYYKQSDYGRVILPFTKEEQ